MFAIAFELVVADTAQHHRKGVSQPCADIGSTLANYGFNTPARNPDTISSIPHRGPHVLARDSTLQRFLSFVSFTRIKRKSKVG
jgi:hypothetical protein